MVKSYNTMRYFEETEKVPRKILYHYTTLDALYNIVSSKTFRLTSLTSSNDKAELTYRINDFWEDLKSAFEKANRPNDYPKDCIKEYNEKYRLANKAMLNSQPYALSLSNKSDSLAHWDRYADRCKGVCISINMSALEIYCKRKNPSLYITNFFSIGGALYTKKERVERLLEYLKVYDSLIDNKKSHVSQCRLYEIYMLMYSQLKKFVKNPSFIDEGEVRIYYSEDTIDSMNKLFKLTPSLYKDKQASSKEFVEETMIEQRKHITTSKGIRSYHDLCLSEIWGNGLIPEIHLGPLCVQNINELKLFLKDNGLNGCKVAKSNVPIN